MSGRLRGMNDQIVWRDSFYFRRVAFPPKNPIGHANHIRWTGYKIIQLTSPADARLTS